MRNKNILDKSLVSKEKVVRILKKIPDPELNVSIWDLGLIYEINILTNGIVKIVMTLTSIGCPLFELMAEPIKNQVKKLPGVKNVEIDLTFDPPWSMERMSPQAKIKLGIS